MTLAPLVLVAGAALEGFVVFVSPMTRSGAIGAEMFNGFVVAPIGVSDATVAIAPGVGFGGRSHGEEEKTTERHGRGYCLTRKRREQLKSHSSLQERGPGLVFRGDVLWNQTPVWPKCRAMETLAPKEKGARREGALFAGVTVVGTQWGPDSSRVETEQREFQTCVIERKGS